MLEKIDYFVGPFSVWWCCVCVLGDFLFGVLLVALLFWGLFGWLVWFWFLVMRGSRVGHGFTAAVAQPGSWVTEGEKRGH